LVKIIRIETIPEELIAPVYYKNKCLGSVTITCPNDIHRIPFWSSLKFHVILERLVCKYYNYLFKFKLLNIIMFMNLYHLMFGMICGYSTKEIIEFINRCDK